MEEIVTEEEIGKQAMILYQAVDRLDAATIKRILKSGWPINRPACQLASAQF